MAMGIRLRGMSRHAVAKHLNLHHQVVQRACKSVGFSIGAQEPLNQDQVRVLKEYLIAKGYVDESLLAVDLSKEIAKD